ncbi:MAG: DUF357 domain-containing protein [Candidatus Aenigmarchaeota archaeon]|nr:DUF357 domain-containing protein [Candidatus Aenigmarchaeota archaeon]
MIDQQLREETEKWLARIKEKKNNVVAKDEKAKEHLKNMEAYISDSEYFLKKGDLVRAFEAVVWAWAILDMLEKLELVEWKC